MTTETIPQIELFDGTWYLNGYPITAAALIAALRGARAMTKIDKGIPLPARLRRVVGEAVFKRLGNSAPRFPFADMEIGDSFHMTKGYASPSVIRHAIEEHPDAQGKRFTTATEDGGLRVWRIA